MASGEYAGHRKGCLSDWLFYLAVYDSEKDKKTVSEIAAHLGLANQTLVSLIEQRQTIEKQGIKEVLENDINLLLVQSPEKHSIADEATPDISAPLPKLDLPRPTAKAISKSLPLSSHPPNDIFTVVDLSFYCTATPSNDEAYYTTANKNIGSDRVTVLFSCNADASVKKKPWVVGTYSTVPDFNKRPPCVQYRQNSNGLLTADILVDFVLAIDAESAGRKIVIVMENGPLQTNVAAYLKNRLENSVIHLTSRSTLPLHDVAVSRIKRSFRAALVRHLAFLRKNLNRPVVITSAIAISYLANAWFLARSNMLRLAFATTGLLFEKESVDLSSEIALQKEDADMEQKQLDLDWALLTEGDESWKESSIGTFVSFDDDLETVDKNGLCVTQTESSVRVSLEVKQVLDACISGIQNENGIGKIVSKPVGRPRKSRPSLVPLPQISEDSKSTMDNGDNQ